ncbi:hypothetical protein RCG17_16045 [Neobacillus sp. PS3-12]|uniref:hypothetical protein n=1 Tax=Neobacillus sp. PS3-12 TaxID=3070677 RepID=UPI0027E09929|nr:hypothetical protein [Neobacillus sp. PS3-12]WML51015.1 hypothetical protein RCG17_16045 [Neobacillus sp. PS3-12]
MDVQTNRYQEQTLFSISWPLFIELALHMGMGIIATLVLSHYSDDAAAGWGVAVGFSYLLGVYYGLGILGVWLAQGADEWLRGCFAYRRWMGKPWERATNMFVGKADSKKAF